jgi:hypothetical protein
MITDRPPRNKALIEEFHASDRLLTLEVPADDRLRRPAKSIEAALKADRRSELKAACTEFLRMAADFYSVPTPEIRVLTARPIRVREGRWATELFGDYAPATGMIRNWMRTAVRKEVTSFGTFLSTLCHEFCHHLDFQRYKFTGSYHTRGFYQRAGMLYHHARNTPLKRLYWIKVPGRRWRIDWPRTNRG